MKIIINKQIDPVFLDKQTITKSGNGAVVYVPKRFIGKKAIIVIEK